MPEPLQIAFLGCGYITGVHSKILRSLPDLIRCAYASRDAAKAAAYCKKYGGSASYSDYASAINDPRVDAVVVAVPPQFHLELTLAALAAGKHVLVEKPAFMCMADYETTLAARDAARRVVLVGENDHYKPLAVCLRRLLEGGRGRRNGVRALHDGGASAQVGGRLAQRRSDGRRGRFLRGGHPLAAPGWQPRAADYFDSRLQARRVTRWAGHASEKHDGRVHL